MKISYPIKNHLKKLFSLSKSSQHHHHTNPMEVEVKLRLPNAAAHQKLSSILSPHHTKTHLQENLFFDTPSLTLATAHHAALRLRFYDLDTHSVLSLKSKPSISSGISRIEELEEPLDPGLGRTCVAEPSRFKKMLEMSRILKIVENEYKVDLNEVVCIGGFRNVRSVYKWNGLVLELDETLFDFGVNYEIECESNDPEKAKVMIEELLNANGIEFSYSDMSKFAIFRSGKLPQI
uniref:triphosphate tunnel metalloenzyme 3-like n=1 Tax=Erigeron canadensis TaxID=72917 RepID=UPI001CB8E060|nr:triphosphate tunnel metalloenzyme 3-like [Erigeron canadensis]